MPDNKGLSVIISDGKIKDVYVSFQLENNGLLELLPEDIYSEGLEEIDDVRFVRLQFGDKNGTNYYFPDNQPIIKIPYETTEGGLDQFQGRLSMSPEDFISINSALDSLEQFIGEYSLNS